MEVKLFTHLVVFEANVWVNVTDPLAAAGAAELFARTYLKLQFFFDVRSRSLRRMGTGNNDSGASFFLSRVL